MSSITSAKLNHVLFVDPKIRRKLMPFYILHIWISLIPCVLMEFYYSKMWVILDGINKTYSLIAFIIVFPLNLLLLYYLLVLTSILYMRISLWVINLLHKSREGIFPRDLNNKDYKFQSIRNMFKHFPSYLTSSTPFPWMRRTLYFLAFDIKIGKGGINRDFWITPEFVEIGENVIIGYASSILSSVVESDKLIIKKITIGDNSAIGANVTLLPGVTLKKNSIISAGSYVHMFQTVEEQSIYSGNPVKFVKKVDEVGN